MNKITFLFEVVFSYYKQNGFWALLRKAFLHLILFKSFKRIDIGNTYQFINQKRIGKEWDDRLSDKNTVNWLVPNFGIGSGGHLNIFRFISFLEKYGYKVNIIIDEPDLGQDKDKIKKIICDNFVVLNADVYFGIEQAPIAYSTFATSWNTAYTLNAFRTTKNKIYFVQDFEPFFYALGSEYIFAENTYRFGFYGITAGKWLSDKLSKDYNMNCNHVGFSYEKERYRVLPQIVEDKPAKKRIFFYARPPTPRRGLELGVMALQRVCQLRDDVEIVFAGWNMKAYNCDFDYEDHGVVELDRLPELYNTCHIALVLSFTNLSLLPLELMASGVPVVSNSGANVEWLLNENICKFAYPDIESISNAIIELIDDDDKRLELIKKGLEFVNQTSWYKEGENFVSIFEELLKGE